MRKVTKARRSMVIYPILFGFFIMGFVDVVGIATNYVKVDFNLSDILANLLPMLVFLWFAVFSIPTGILMDKIGRKYTVLVALAITSFAMLVPLCYYQFESILFAFALLGIGNTMLQVSLNPMVAQVVSKDKITSVLTLGQFIKAISSFLGPIIAALAASFWGDWKLIFVVYAATTLLAIVWLFISIEKDKATEVSGVTFSTTLSLFKDPYIVMLFFGILAIVGIDVGLNTSIPKLLMEKTGMPLSEAGLGSSLYFAARTAGSFIGALILVRYSGVKFLKISMLVALIAFVVMLVTQTVALLFVTIVLVSLACSNVFSIIFSEALQHNPERANEISALMIMGVSGGALVMPIMGLLSDNFGQVAGISVLLLCLVFIYLSAFKMKK